MTSIFRSFYCSAIVLGFVFALGSNAVAAPDDATLNRVVDLNKKALVSYENLDIEAAAKQLKQALELCNAEGLERHPAAARTYIHLGVIYVSGLKEKDKGVAQFRLALGIDPNIKVTKSLLNPEVQAAFDAALTKGGETPSPAAVPFPTGQTSSRRTNRSTSATSNTAGINHPPITEAAMGKAIEIKVQIPSGMRAEKIVLAYRASDDEEFLAREMRPIEKANGWYHGKIPAEATQGERVSYYIEAQNGDGQALGASGTSTAPHSIRLGSESSIDEGKAKPGDSRGNANESPLWFLFAVGGGGGYFSGSPEMNPRSSAGEIKTSGTGLAKLAHLAPEIGYFQTDNLLFSIQGRLQYVTGSQDVVKDGQTYKTTKFALAGLAKASYILAEPSSAFQPFVSAQLGFGEIRYPTTTVALPGCGANNGPAPCKDTIRGGVGLAGIATGFTYMFSESVGLYTAISGLVGVPNFAINADLNVGLAIIK